MACSTKATACENCSNLLEHGQYFPTFSLLEMSCYIYEQCFHAYLASGVIETGCIMKFSPRWDSNG
jgi:hypothetical protein